MLLLRCILPFFSLSSTPVVSALVLDPSTGSPHPLLPPPSLDHEGSDYQQPILPSPHLPRHVNDEYEAMNHSYDVASPPPPPVDADVIWEPASSPPMSPSHHHGAGTPLTVLNETEILLHHQPNPLSYWTHDLVFDATDAHLGGRGQWGGWILWGHALGMTAVLVLLFPLAHALRATPYSTPILLSTLLFTLLGLVSSAIYKAHTPDLYAHNSHAPLGWVVVSLFSFASGWDLWKATCEAKNGGWKAKLWRVVGVVRRRQETVENYQMIWGGEGRGNTTEEQVGLHTIHEGEEDEDEQRLVSSPVEQYEEEVALFSPSSPTAPTHLDDENSPRSSTSTLQHHHHHQFDVHHQHFEHSSTLSTPQRVFLGLLTFVWSLIPLLGVASFLSGITIYSGSCRAEYVNGCAAHLIKGAIFFFFGLFTFARYLGAWAELGWAWNVRPQRPRCRLFSESNEKASWGGAEGGSVRKKESSWTMPSAEAVECAIIFTYGLTNTWMERFGAEPGSAFTIHQVQHISIALLFLFGGALGLLLESSVAKRLLAAPVAIVQRRSLNDVEKPPTWSGSFNPFPAVVVGVTGLVMGAHRQTYLFQVHVHALWGNLLAMFGVFRILTYTFLWLRPPRSTLASRPPTEALAAFSVSCGGLAFILSNEQVVYGAMRSGWDDIMSFLTLTICQTALLFIWLFLVLVAKGWATERNTRRHGSASRQSSISSSTAVGVEEEAGISGGFRRVEGNV